ncbi:MAG: triose-phosphate isomerase [Thermaurantiacus sp.]
MQHIVGNWKMHGLAASLAEADAVRAAGPMPEIALALCPPATLVHRMAMLLAGSHVAVGGQDCHAAPDGAHTGDIAAEMLADAGASLVILGHSERRADHRETDDQVRAKVRAAWRAGLRAIVCVGETEAERDRGETLAVVMRQLAGSVPEGADAARLLIAYEPVWAIGTGRTPTLAEVQEVHTAIAGAALAGVPILYGGSVKPGNAAELLAVPHVGGALVGGASLKAADFLAIARAARHAESP